MDFEVRYATSDSVRRIDHLENLGVDRRIINNITK
jgi:hypothetical protein